MSSPCMRPPPQYEDELPIPDGDVYDPFLALSDVLDPREAVHRDQPNSVDLTGLGYPEQTLLKLRIQAGPEHDDTPTTSHAPDEWRGRITDVTFGGMGARTLVTYEWPGGSNTSAGKPVPNHGRPNGYHLTGIDLLVEFFDVDPVGLADLDTPLPVPLRKPFDLESVDYVTLRDELFRQSTWHDRPDEFIIHQPWRPDLVTEAVPYESVYDEYETGDWVSLNPKYRGRFSP